jgi:hypothetical protein
MSEIGAEEALKSPEIEEFLKDLYSSYGFILKKIFIEVMYLSYLPPSLSYLPPSCEDVPRAPATQQRRLRPPLSSPLGKYWRHFASFLAACYYLPNLYNPFSFFGGNYNYLS